MKLKPKAKFTGYDTDHAETDCFHVEADSFEEAAINVARLQDEQDETVIDGREIVVWPWGLESQKRVFYVGCEVHIKYNVQQVFGGG